jgi:hypothetical protein
VACATLASPVQASDTTDDHPPGDGDLFHGVGVGGVIDRPGDHDWYFLDLPIDYSIYARVRITGGPCIRGELQMTLLNPEQRPVKWTKVPGGSESRGADLAFPSSTPGRYFIEVDAGAHDECAGTTYSIERTPNALHDTGAPSQRVFYDIAHSGCHRARRQITIDRSMVKRSRNGLEMFSAAAKPRYRAYEREWSSKLAHDRMRVAGICGRSRRMR